MAADSKTLNALFDALTDHLLDVVKNGEDAVVGEQVVKISVKPATLAVARQLLKDNGIEARGVKNNPIGALADALPYASASDDDDAPTTFN